MATRSKFLVIITIILVVIVSVFYVRDINQGVEAQELVSEVELDDNVEEKLEIDIKDENIVRLLNENDFLRKELIRLSINYQGKAKNIPVLLYHHLLPQEDIKSDNPSIISKENFEEQMKYLYDNHFLTATIEELEQYLNGEIDLPKNSVVITFDDGYLSNIVHGYPILKKYGQKATIFMIGDVASEPQAEYSPVGLQFISASTISQYEDVFNFGCHTYSMHKKDNDVARLISYDKEKIIEDLLKNRELLNSKYIAYPHGEYNKNTLDILEDLGYKLGFAATHGYAKKTTNKFEIPRIVIYPTTNLSRFTKIVK